MAVQTIVAPNGIVQHKRTIRQRKIYEITINQVNGKTTKLQTTALDMVEAYYLAQKQVPHPWSLRRSVNNQSKVSFSLTVKCIGTVARKPARAKAIIEAEKKAKALAAAKSAKQQSVWRIQAKNEEKIRTENLRKRVHNQFAYAFSQVKADPQTAPAASNYITCSACERPAAYLIMTRNVDAKATKIDMESVADAVCEDQGCHIGHYKIQRQKLPHIRCDKLEFFFPDVMRTPVIAIKGFMAAQPAQPAVVAQDVCR